MAQNGGLWIQVGPSQVGPVGRSEEDRKQMEMTLSAQAENVADLGSVFAKTIKPCGSALGH